jgi:hypothetical protein
MKEMLPSFFSLSSEFFDLQPSSFYPAMITPSLITNVFELLWSTNGDDIYVKCIQLHEFIVTFSIDKPHVDSTWLHASTNKLLLHSIILHLEVASDSCEHFFNPYINLHLENFDFFHNASTCASVVDFHNEVFIFLPSHVPLLVLDLGFHFNIHVVSSASFPFV